MCLCLCRGQDEDDAEGDWQEESPEHEVTSQDIPLKSTEMTEERRAKLREIEVNYGTLFGHSE